MWLIAASTEQRFGGAGVSLIPRQEGPAFLCGVELFQNRRRDRGATKMMQFSASASSTCSS
jgi:hypothetical protein